MELMKKSYLNFIVKCIAVSGIAFLLLLLLNYRYKQVMDDPYADAHKFDFMNSTYNNIQIANIGSSHGEYAFYYEELTKQSGYECFNFAMASQTYNYDLAILSMYREHFAKDSILFIPISYFSFNDEVVNETERESLNAKYYTFLSPRYIPGYSPYIDLVTHRMPILSAGEDIVKLFPSNILYSFMPLKAFAAESSVLSPEELKKETEAQFYEKALNRYQRHMENKEEYFMQERIDNLYDIIDFCMKNGITPVLITTPYTSYYTDMVSAEFKTEFYDTIHAITAATSVPYYDYSQDERFTSHLEYFADADHLDTGGAIAFMNIIKEEIPEYREFLQNNDPIHNGDPNWQPPY